MKAKFVLSSFFIFVSLVFSQGLLEETRKLLQLQGMQSEQQRQSTQQYPTEPSVVVQPYVTSPSMSEQIEVKEIPKREMILPSDILIVRTAKVSYVIGVDKDGYAEFPFGVRKVAGLTPLQIEEMFYTATNGKVSVEIGTSPKLSSLLPTIMPQYVSLIGDFVRPGVTPPGSLGFCIGSAMGLNQTASGKLRIYSRGKIEKLDLYHILKIQPEKLNMYIEPGSIIYAEKSSGWINLENVGNVFAKLRDVALTIIAWIELDNYARQRGWW